jgi:hypothetical protein
MESMSSHWLKNYFNGWTMEDLIWQRDTMHKFGATERERLDVIDEIKRREVEANDKTCELPRTS